YIDSRSPPGVALPRAPPGATLPTSFASLPIVVHLPKQLLDVLHARHHTGHGAGRRPAAKFVLLQRRRPSTRPFHLQRQCPAAIDADKIWQPTPVRPSISFDHVGALPAQPAHDGLGDGRFGHRTPSFSKTGDTGDKKSLPGTNTMLRNPLQVGVSESCPRCPRCPRNF